MNILKVINSLVPTVLASDYQVEFELQTNRYSLLHMLIVLKNHGLLRLNTLMEVTAVDSPHHILRFYVSYFLLSMEYNARARVSLQVNELTPVLSITLLFSSAN
jgi:NADH-quinone oxidoreductase subunit C